MSKIMLITPSQTMGMVLKSQLLAELDARISIFQSASAALNNLVGNRYDIIICSKEMEGLTGFQFYRELQVTQIAEHSAFILLTSDDSPKKLKEIENEQIEHYIVVPADQKDLVRKIDLVYNPRITRTAERYHVPNTDMIIMFGDVPVRGTVLNLSYTGIFCEVELPEELPSITQPHEVHMQFSQDYRYLKLKGLQAKVRRLDALSWWPGSGAPKLVHMVLILENVFEDEHEILRQVFEQTARQIAEQSQQALNAVKQ